ncbi:hypothetical protein [Actinokineospora fastidiosa]|uniref:Uncharacterized protein n=1 Tax=Actinokineospora fastidiosa TaxID=1816 RepID=A0A918GT74_9PSEU|nr:hypothetical protein [Actinokineospora fastidiosa]GGS60396.1 hypothetical protein GCM10010171_64120 [Actinokineospora fastidiosa]
MVYAFDPFLDEDTPHGDFGVAVRPLSLCVGQLAEASAHIRTWAGPAPLPLTLTVSGLPEAVLGLFEPDCLAAGAESRLTVTVGASAARRTYAVTVTATGPNGRIARAYLSLTIR